MKKKKVVIIGGGNGSALTINALKNNPNYELSAVVPMSDSNFSSGAMRRYFDLLPPGDILRAVLALSSYDYSFLKKIFFCYIITFFTLPTILFSTNITFIP